jgi:hypothetical protein
MQAGRALFLVAAAMVTLTASAAGSQTASKQRIAITSQAAKATQVSHFVLTPLESGPLKGDSGTLSATFPPEHVMLREGQTVTVYQGTAILKGKRGTLVLRYRDEYVDGGNGYHPGLGTWKTVRGTGQYVGITGGGRTGNVSLDRGPWSSRNEGFVTLP